MTSKEQERKALERIRKIVAELGENSYIGMAFEGCFEIAEENIANDWGCSMKYRAEAAEAKLEKSEKDIAALQERINNLDGVIRIKDELYERMAKKVNSMKLTADDLTDINGLLNDRLYEVNQTIKQAEQDIITYSDDPTSDGFRDAVASRKTALSCKKCYEAIMEHVSDTYMAFYR